jgi:hypothetical protein
MTGSRRVLIMSGNAIQFDKVGEKRVVDSVVERMP